VHLIAGLQRGEFRLRHKKAHLQVFRRPQRDDRLARGDKIAGAVENLFDCDGGRCGATKVGEALARQTKQLPSHERE
jgi:hypothetical protein